MQRSTPEGVRRRQIASGGFLFVGNASVERCDARGECHLSATLAAFILSIIITCLLLYIVVWRLIPRLAEGLFTISTSRGPEACCTASETDNAPRCDEDQQDHWTHLKLDAYCVNYHTQNVDTTPHSLSNINVLKLASHVSLWPGRTLEKTQIEERM